MEKRTFFAYAGEFPLIAETCREVVEKLVQNNINARHWEQMSVDGRIIIDEILEEINSADYLVAEISSLNYNVLFEVGYAIAKNKPVLLAVDNSDSEVNSNISRYKYLDNIGQVRYEGNVSKLHSRVNEFIYSSPKPLYDVFIANAKAREGNALFSPSVPMSFSGPERLQSHLETRTEIAHLVLGDRLEGDLLYYTRNIYRSSACIFHILKESRADSKIYNAKSSLLAGFAHGLDIPTILVGESGVVSALDYRSLFYQYQTAADLVDHVKGWLDKFDLRLESDRRPGNLDLKIELPFRSFGDYVAENEKNDLQDYFVETNEFEAVCSGRSQVFVGRKGTGKTATLFQTLNELKKDKRVLTVPIKPSSYDLGALIGILKRFDENISREFFFKSMWTYLLKTEMAISIFNYMDSLPAKSGGNPVYENLKESLDDLKIDVLADMSTRIDDIILGVNLKGDIDDATKFINSSWVGIHEERLRQAAKEFNRIAILIDNLDKTWEKGSDFSELSHFILALLSASKKLEMDLEKRRSNMPSVKVTLAIFLRADIFHVLREYAREPDKINVQIVQWRDEQLLIRVLEERYVAHRGGKVSPESMWTELFADEVHGLKMKDYFLWRSLPRPRDIIYLGNSALTTAINRNHSKVTDSDIRYAEKEYYSSFAVDALLVESVPQEFDLDEVLLCLSGVPATNSEEKLREYLDYPDNFEEILDWLIQTSFLGIESKDGKFIYVDGEQEARKKRKISERVFSGSGRSARYRIHPAFRPYLEIDDDDIYNN